MPDLTQASQTPLAILQQVFGYADFRGRQAAVVEHVLGGGDALVLMPTGGGKSMCYQLPAIARHRAGGGVTLVVSPLIALMHDQVGALRELGVLAAQLNSTQGHEETLAVQRQLLAGELALVYAAPERVTTPRFLELLDDLHARGRLALFAIDEAHCVSQWGHDFRPEYRALSLLHERWPQVPRIALTATADALTRDDITERLQLQGAQRFVSSFDRANIAYRIVEKSNPTQQLLRFIEDEHANEAGIVYAQSRRRVEELAEALRGHGLDALPYHAGLDAATRQRHQDRFLREEGVIMVATIAFGMGIDKPDVRFVAHVDLPKNIESYYQETGRAGRDGLPAEAWMAYGLQDVVNQRRMIDDSEAGEDFKQIMRGKLDALLALAEATDCRRQRLLAYFGEEMTASGSADYRSNYCGHCDNCLQPPEVWDATDAARKLLSTVYRVQEMSGIGFGAGQIIDIVRGSDSEKLRRHGHQRLSTFGVGAGYSAMQLRGVLRQLIATGALHVDAGAYNTLQLQAVARPILRGEQAVQLRASTAQRAPRQRRQAAPPAEVAALDAAAQARFAALKAWRLDVAREQGLPAYVIFQNATLAAIAARNPQTLAALGEISGVGQTKLERHGARVLEVCAEAG